MLESTLEQLKGEGGREECFQTILFAKISNNNGNQKTSKSKTLPIFLAEEVAKRRGLIKRLEHPRKGYWELTEKGNR